MKASVFVVLMGIFVGTSAHAGVLEMLGLGAKKEPTTLAQACDTDEIKKVCPEMILGEMSVTDCLIKNVQELSTQCATYIKKVAKEKVAAATDAVTDHAAAAMNDADTAKSDAAARVTAAKESAKQMGESMRTMKESAKSAAAAFKAML